ncbi:MAG: sugar phosphate isomerase/epimerase [Kiritimatiellae bacterium]|nr:sugar phosphate isomerase/epimerase [Kiritimatiellia bacterium]
MMDRRSFLGLGALAMLAAGCQTTGAKCASAGCCKKGKVPFKLGVAGYTYNKFSIDETLAFLERLDVHYLCIKNFHLPFDSTPAQIAEFKKKCADHGVTGYGVGPIYMASNEEAKKAFDYAAAIGVKTVVAVPTEEKEMEVGGKKKKVRFHSRARCEYLAGLCKEYDMRIAIHNHGPDIPYCFPTGESAFNMVKDLDARMGLCLDIGHDFRAGQNPADSIRKYGSRIYDMHIKNVKFDPKKNIAVPMPRGDMDMWEIVKALVEVNYTGCCSLEYERDFKDNLAGVAESIGYFKGLIKAVEG